MSSSNLFNTDDDLYEGDSSNQEYFPELNLLPIPQNPPEVNNFYNNLPEMATQWYTAIQNAEAQTTSTPPKRNRRHIKRNREAAQNTIQQQYFVQPPERMYDDNQFRRRFRMRRHVFERIVADVTNCDPYFQQREDACGIKGFTGLHKCTVAMRHLAYGAAYDQLDEYLQMGITTVKHTVEHFAKGIIAVYEKEYLRPPNPEDIARLQHVASIRGFPGMLGSIDCMHWQWKNCPMAWKGQFQGRSGKASVILEAVASYDTWIWHAFFGMAGSNNDINVLDKSPLFDDVCEGKAPRTNYEVNGNAYERGYYLTDGIYPKWAAFMPAYTSPNEEKKKLFTRKQESYRKDVERAFGILQARFSIIRNPALYCRFETMGHIMKACIILHNMIVEDERDTYGLHVQPGDYEHADTSNWHSDPEQHVDLATYKDNWNQVRNRVLHEQLKADLTEHVYNHFRGQG